MGKNSKNINKNNDTISKNTGTVSKNNKKNETVSKNNKKSKKSNNNKPEEKSLYSKAKDKGALFILISEVLVAVGMLIVMFNKENFIELTTFKGSKLIWSMYFVTQIIWAFTILSKKKDENKSTFHIEAMLVTISYLLIV